MSDQQPAATGAPNPGPSADEQWIDPYTDPEDRGEPWVADTVLGPDGPVDVLTARMKSPGEPGYQPSGALVRGDVAGYPFPHSTHYEAVDLNEQDRRGKRGSGRSRPSFKPQDWVVPFVVMGIGVALGLIDLVSVEAPGTLRIPALIAALFLFGASLNEVLPVQATKVRLEKRVEAEEESGPDPGPPKVHQRGVAPPPPPAAPPAPNMGPAVFLMGLGIVLGLAAALTFPSAPVGLTLLSLLAAFLIFYRGLGELPIK